MIHSIYITIMYSVILSVAGRASWKDNFQYIATTNLNN